jgi:hypothetical protein
MFYVILTVQWNKTFSILQKKLRVFWFNWFACLLVNKNKWSNENEFNFQGEFLNWTEIS